MNKTMVGVISALMGALGSISSAQAATVATVYQDCNYGGYAVGLSVGTYTTAQLKSLGIQPSDLSSVRIAPGYQITLYRYDGFSGTPITLISNDSCLVADNFNDATDSIVVSPIGATTPVAKVYQDCSYGGYSVGLPVGSYTTAQLKARGIVPGDLSSAQVTPGYQIKLYSADGFSGTSLTLTSNHSCMVADNFNDATYSAVVSVAESTTPVVKVYQDCNYGGYAVGLPVGSYTTAQLKARGIQPGDLSSAQVTPGYQIKLYSSDNFSGTSLTLTSNHSCMVADNFNDEAYSAVVSAVVPGTVNPTFNFTVVNGKIMDPTGHPWVGAGIALYDREVLNGVGTMTSGVAVAQRILTQFPRINLIRIACYSFASPAAYAPFVEYMTSRGIVVVIEDHNNQHTVLSGSALQTESNWYATQAAYYLKNPYVMFQTMNEPNINDAYQEQATYNAIRATGNNTPIFMEAGSWAGGGVSSIGDTTVFSSMRNIAWDMHLYAQGGNTSTTTLANILTDQNNRIANLQTIRSADGVMPVIGLEGGNSVNGTTLDPAGVLQVQANFTNPSLQGFAAWIWHQGYSGINDNLTSADGLSLNSYGQQVAGYIAKGVGPVPIASP